MADAFLSLPLGLVLCEVAWLSAASFAAFGTVREAHRISLYASLLIVPVSLWSLARLVGVGPERGIEAPLPALSYAWMFLGNVPILGVLFDRVRAVRMSPLLLVVLVTHTLCWAVGAFWAMEAMASI